MENPFEPFSWRLWTPKMGGTSGIGMWVLRPGRIRILLAKFGGSHIVIHRFDSRSRFMGFELEVDTVSNLPDRSIPSHSAQPCWTKDFAIHVFETWWRQIDLHGVFLDVIQVWKEDRYMGQFLLSVDNEYHSDP